MARRLRTFLGPHAPSVYLLVGALAVLGYVTLVPSTAGAALERLPAFLRSLPGDLGQYVWRFAAATVLFGAVPLATVLLSGERPADIGLRRPRSPFPGWIWLPVVLVCLAIALVGAYTPALARYYPYSKTLLELVDTRGALPFLLHAAAYLLLYYVPWEILFRGFMLFALVRLAEANNVRAFRVLFTLASLQSLPSALVHLGHPASEVFGALAWGLITAFLVLRCRSILPGLALHAGIGILQDWLIYLRHAGVLP